MGQNTEISWTDHTFNPWWGCDKVSAGCKFCYAETLDNRWNHAEPHWGPNSPRKAMSESYWQQPEIWDANAKKAGVKAKVFCASMADVFEDNDQVLDWPGVRQIQYFADKNPGVYFKGFRKQRGIVREEDHCMTLGFKTQINGKPTYFIEKIWAGLVASNKSNEINKGYYAGNYNSKFNCFWDGSFKTDHDFIVPPKIHTIREDKNNRWKAGNDIHFVINNRSADRFQFAPVVSCVGTQYFQVLWENNRPTVYLGNSEEDWAPFYFSEPDEPGEMITYGDEQMKQLAINDGFDSMEDFFNYFNQNFTGKIIHWTNFKY